MQKIIPHLWFDDQAEEAAEFYTSLFKKASIGRKAYYTEAGFEVHGQPAGKLMTISFELEDFQLIGLNGGPVFKFNPSISFMIHCDTQEEVENLHDKLIDGGVALMPLSNYPFSEKYAWVQDKYGLSWQIMLVKNQPMKQKIVPKLMFTGDVCGKAEEAMKLYASLFTNSSIEESAMRYDGTQGPDKAGTLMHANVTLAGVQFAVMDSAAKHQFTFNEAISLLVECNNQEEINRLWDALTAGGDPAAQQCGWLKDKYGVSWQITPTVLNEMMQDNDSAKVERVTDAFLRMKKFDIEQLQKAYEG